MEERNTSAKFRWDDTKAKTGGTGLCGLKDEGYLIGQENKEGSSEAITLIAQGHREESKGKDEGAEIRPVPMPSGPAMTPAMTPPHPKIENVKIGGTTIKIKAETEGFEEAREEAENLAEALEAFSPLVQIKNCKGCTFNIYPTQKIACEEYELEK